MIFKAQTHTINKDELDQLIELGVQFKDCGDPPETLLNQYFPNLQLGDFLKGLHSVLTPVCLKPLKITVTFKNEAPSLNIEFISEEFTQDGFALMRTFKHDNGELNVSHDFFSLPTAHQGIGIAKKVMSLSIQQYVNLNVQKIKVHAGLDGGGYAWALYDFFVADKKQIDVILGRASIMLDAKQFSFVKKIYDKYYSKNIDGKAFPISKWAEMPFMKEVLRGAAWDGFIDLNNTEQFSNFINYAIS